MINRVLYLYVNTWNDKSCPLSLRWNDKPCPLSLVNSWNINVSSISTLILGMINRVLYLYVNTWNDKSCPLSLR